MDRNRTTRRNEFLPLAKFKTYKLKNYNFRLILLLLVICGLGIAIIGSANDGSDNRAVFKQAIGMVIGFSGMIVISNNLPVPRNSRTPPRIVLLADLCI